MALADVAIKQYVFHIGCLFREYLYKGGEYLCNNPNAVML